MKSPSITDIRLQNHHLIYPDFKTVHEVVQYYGCVQSQDYPAAKWALSLRMKNATEEIIEKALVDGKILRTHIMRPTWHFVTPEDIRYILKLTSPRVQRFNASMMKQTELDAEILNKAIRVLEKSLRDSNYLTRTELAQALAENGIIAAGQRLAYIVMNAELEGVICSGPRKGKQFSYALLEERVPPQKEISQDESMAKLALTYFTSHGPAQVKDFSWWSGMTVKDSREGIEMIKSHLEEILVDEKTYFHVPSSTTVQVPKPFALLLSIYDEYTIAYNDRSDLSEKKDIERMIQMGNALTAVIILDGKVAGTWKRELKKDSITITLSPFREFTKAEQQAVIDCANRYGVFINLPVQIQNNQS